MGLKNLIKLANYYEVKYDLQLNKIAKTVGINTYHGTSADYLSNIAEKGLQAKAPMGVPHATKAVYLTNTIETAARYCRDFDKPVVLEIYISSPKRVNKLQQDPLDTDESLYENYDSETFYSEDVRRIEDGINEVFDIKNRYSCPINLPDEIENFRGFDLYGEIKNYAKTLDLDLRKIKEKIKEKLPPQDLDYLRINESGIVSLLPSVYDRFHQMFYRENIPAVAIKSVWIPKNKIKPEIAANKEERKFGRRLIPADIRELNYIINNFKNDFYRSNNIELSDMEDVIEKLEEADTFGLFKKSTKWSASFIDRLKELKDSFIQSSEEEQENIKLEFYNEFRDLDPLDPGEIAGVETWVKISIDSLETLKKIPSLYN